MVEMRVAIGKDKTVSSFISIVMIQQAIKVIYFSVELIITLGLNVPALEE